MSLSSPSGVGRTANNIAFTGGSLDNVTIGATTAGPSVRAKKVELAGNLPAGSQNAANSYIYNVAALTGTAPGVWSPFYFSTNDLVDASAASPGALNFWNITLNTTTGHKGNRNNINAIMSVGGTPAAGDTTNAYQNITAVTRASVNVGGTELTYGKSHGGLWAVNPNAFLLSGATNWGFLAGIELDNSIPVGSSVVRNLGMVVVHTTTHANRGTLEDAGLSFVDQSSGVGWWRAVEFGGQSSGFPLTSDSTVIKATRTTSPTLGSAPVIHTGIDFQEASATFYQRFQHNAVDGSGTSYANGVVTTGTVDAQAATLSSLSIGAYGGHTGGTYQTKPSIVVQAPPAGGTQATASVTTMGLERIPVVGGVSVAGTGYTIGDVLTVSGATGTAATLTVATVDGSGGVTSAAVTSAGSMSAVPANPAGVTGGTGSGAKFVLYYKILTTTITNAGSGYAASPPPKVWTSGFSDSDVVPAALAAVMSASAATLSLNPSGGPIKAPLLTNAANDTAAASAGVQVGEFYRNGSVVMQRVS